MKKKIWETSHFFFRKIKFCISDIFFSISVSNLHIFNLSLMWAAFNLHILI